MEYSDKIINGGIHIKVNKKQSHINISPNYLINDIQLGKEQFQPQRFTNNTIFSRIQRDKINKNYNINYNSSQNGSTKNYYTEGNYPLSSTNKELKFNRINISKKFNKIANKINYSSINENKYQKKFADKDNGNKLYIYKSETQYPFITKKEEMIENENKSMKNLSISPDDKTVNLKYYNPNKKYNFEKTEVRNKKYILKDYEKYTSSRKSDYNKSTDNNYSELTFNKLGHNFYKGYKKDKESINNYANNTSDNFNNIIYNNKTEGYIKKNKNNNNNYKNNNINNESNDKKLLNIYKNKLINIFVRLITNFYYKYIKKLFNEIINNIKEAIKNNERNIIYQTKKLNFGDIELDNKTNFFYIKKHNINLQDNITNNNKYNLGKLISLNKNLSSMTMYKKALKKNSFIRNENNQKTFINYKTNINTKIDNNNIIKDSSKNIYIPKNRNNNYNPLSRQKDSIFKELKINKSTRLFERNPNLYQNPNINTQINNFYNTNNSNFYINKINSFSSVMTIEKQKPKIFLSKNIQENIPTSKEKKNIKLEIFKNKKNFKNVIYKKILSNEKNSEKDTENKNNDNNNNINIFMKRMERVYNKNKINRNFADNINQTYSIKRIYKNININNNDINKNQFATIVNYTSDGNENNCNNIDISNDINNYNLEDIDKPMNMMYMKHDNDYEDNDNNDEDFDDIDIKNLLQMITNDKRLYLNFNYIAINKYNTNNKNYRFKKNKYKITKPNSIYISNSKENKNNLGTTNNSNNISFNETPETINMNLTKYIKKRKIKSAILKLDNFINDKIYEYKTIILKILKSIKFKSIIYNIIQNRSIDMLKKYFDIFKNNTILKEQNEIKYEEINEKTNSKNIILNKKNINYIIDEKDFDEMNLVQNKDKLKFLVKQINKGNNEEENNHLNTSFDNDNVEIIGSNGNNNYKIPLWKSVQNISISKKIYTKKNAKIKNSKNELNRDDYDNNERKIELLKNKLINFVFCKNKKY
jgi:hypothetical protein